MITAGSAACLLLALLSASSFVIGIYGSTQVSLTRDEILAASRYFPDSAYLQGLLAEAELANLSNHEETAGRAEMAASRAVSLTPARYNFHLLLASAREMKGDRAGAESALREAVQCAPHRTEVQWRMANLLVRQGKLDEALGFFSPAVSARPALLPQTMALVWAISGGRIE